MILSFTMELPDSMSDVEVAGYLREHANSAADQLEGGIIPIPKVDETIHFDVQDDRVAMLFRSE